jgi:SAM-dependent methyltransferase
VGGAYLEGAARAAFDEWQERALARFSPPLTFPEVRRGVQALSSLYVERRAGGDLASRALEGAAKRAAFSCFYAPLHFLTLFHALRGVELGRVVRIVDLGCGTCAAAAAVVSALAADGAAPRVLGIDRSGFALGEARRTCAAFGLRAQLRRGSLPEALPRFRSGDAAVAAWCANELAPAARQALRDALVETARAGAAVVVAEPLATGVAPWWRDWVRALADFGGRAWEARARIPLPAFLARLDRAAGLDHRELGARVLAVPASEARSEGAARAESVRRRTRLRPRRPAHEGPPRTRHA